MTRIIDLSYPLEAGMPTYPTHWHPMVEVTQLGRHGIENRETRKLVLGTHTGTHCDSPRHFFADGPTLDDLALDTFVGEATVVDLTDLEGVCVGAEDLLRRSGAGRKPERLLLRYDWSRTWGEMRFFTEYPYLSIEAAHWLVEKSVRLIGMDTPSPDNPEHGWKAAQDSPVHKVLMKGNVVLLEYLCNLASLPSGPVHLIALPLRLTGSDGSPVRCVATVE